MPYLSIVIVLCAGHDFMFTRQEEVGQYDFAWLEQYGPTWRTGGHLGVSCFPVFA